MWNILFNIFKDFIYYGYLVTCLLIILLLMLYTIENVFRHKRFGIIKSFILTIIIPAILLYVGVWLENLLEGL